MPKRIRAGRRITETLILAVLVVNCLALAQAPTSLPVVVTSTSDNAPAQRDKPYVILVSIDGFRFDYAQRYGADNLLALAARGASASDGMIPVVPSLTFPNHISIITGLYPAHHGIVGNVFYDPQRQERYVYTDRAIGADGSWYGGVPLWVLAEKQGMLAACLFWPGSEAEIAGARPSYYLPYDTHVSNEARVDQVIEWLRLPPERRPHFITLYFLDVDAAGHESGPDSTETADAVRRVDASIGRLIEALPSLHLPVDVIVVSDHGMANVSGPWINLEDYADLRGFETAGSLLYAPSEAAAAKAYAQLRGASNKFVVYRRSKLPARFHLRENPRIGDPVVIPTRPYLIRARKPNNTTETPPKGMHGYDPATMKTMRAIFYAAGPDIRQDVKLAPFENINVYPLIAEILGLKTGAIDGRPRVLEPALYTKVPATADLPR
jgi:predicted AlkP superfamily pyrophosphatase or phosphodiesterase